MILSSFCFVAILLLVSCQPETETSIVTIPAVDVFPTDIPHPSLEPTRTASGPTATVTVKPTSTPVPTMSATIVAEVTTPTITAVTLTPLPTFTAIQLEMAVAELLANPMNCDVPCWWGAIPSETTVFEVQEFLTLYQYENYFTRDNDHDQIPDYIELESGKGLFDFNVRYGFENTVLTSLTSFQSPTISSVIRKFGQPDEVFISAENDPRQQPPLIRFTIDYLQQGISVGYVVNGEFQDDVVRGCFTEEKAGRLNLVVPSSATSYKDFTTFNEELVYLSLEESTDLTIEDFMQLFSDPNQPQCIETPIELWEWG